MLQCVAVCCSVLQCVAVRCSVLQCSRCIRINTYINIHMRVCVCLCVCVYCLEWCRGHVRTRITLQHTATHCNTLQHTTTHCNTLQHTATHCNTLQHTATHCNTLQHTATHCNTLQHMSERARAQQPQWTAFSAYVFVYINKQYCYWVASISRLLTIIGLFCRI